MARRMRWRFGNGQCGARFASSFADLVVSVTNGGETRGARILTSGGQRRWGF